jgi:hypothetical protein
VSRCGPDYLSSEERVWWSYDYFDWTLAPLDLSKRLKGLQVRGFKSSCCRMQYQAIDVLVIYLSTTRVCVVRVIEVVLFFSVVPVWPTCVYCLYEMSVYW